jgi:hypothetical protein
MIGTRKLGERDARRACEFFRVITQWQRRNCRHKDTAVDDKCYLKMSELLSPYLRRILIPSTMDVILV